MTKYICGRCEVVFVSQDEDEDVKCIMCEAICVYKVPFSFGGDYPINRTDRGQKYSG